MVIFCLVPEALEERLFKPLRDHYADDDRVRVIIDRRNGDRRAGPAITLPLTREEERRRGTDRRRAVLQRTVDRFPGWLAGYRDEVRFVQRLLPVSSGLESLATDDVVELVRQGDGEAPTELYWRCFERMHSRLALLLGHPDEADRAIGAAFGRVLDAIDAAPQPIRDFDELLYAAVDAGVVLDQPVAPGPDDRVFEPAERLSLAVADPLLDEPVVVTDRDPLWFSRAQAERNSLLRLAAGHVVGIEHIGGTAVPVVPGRPIVDLLVGVEALPVPPALHAVLLERGYENCGDAGNPARAYYRRRGLARFDVHVVQHGSDLWYEPIRLREHLRRNAEDAYAWGVARREAALEAGHSLLRYAERREAALGALLEQIGEQTPQRAA